ncbi:MAG: hypothetical protein ACK4M9_16330 [Anaerobacillus sp.]|uniref:hypothetical protein n=1 Tax=Anaerobacillus sp. TaxID=1872506 RepID=UPI00391915D3
MTNNYYLVKTEVDYRQQQVKSEMTKVAKMKGEFRLNLFKGLFERQPKSCCPSVCCIV